jgi:hypothetical protein
VYEIADAFVIEDERLLARHFRGWGPGEIAEGRAPVLAIVMDGAPVSVCLCAVLRCTARRGRTGALAVARKLELSLQASIWNISPR